MITNKMSPMLQIALRYQSLLTPQLQKSFVIDSNQNIWELIIDYVGSLSDIVNAYNLVDAYDLQDGFAKIRIQKDQISNLSNEPKVLTLSLPRRQSYIDIGIGQVCAGNLVSESNIVTATGKGVLLAVIDSGIRYNHPDFITDSGESRILYLWDQTIGDDDSAVNGGGGVVYDRTQINEALAQTDEAAQLAIVPSQDTLGHGTALAGIAAGNGRGSSNGQNRGMAPECELIIVKVGRKDPLHPRDIEIMQGIWFAIERAVELQRPLTILLGIGSNVTGHDGSAPLEMYISRRYNNWLLNFVVGTGNEGNTSAHASGMLKTGQTQSVQLSIETNQLNEYACCIWKKFSDEMNLMIQTPTGEQTDVLSLLTPNRAYLFDDVAVLINYSEPVSSVNEQVIFILFQAQDDTILGEGLWTFNLIGDQIIEGDYHIWGAIVTGIAETSVSFFSPDITQTLTTPSTAYMITSVGAYNGASGQVAAFSGRGFTADNRVAPDLVAPGVDIIAPSISNTDLYTTITGTSAAAAFVAGAYVLMMEYGVYTLNNLNYYGDELRIYLLRNARRPNSYAPYPNGTWGYGLLCVEAALVNMGEIAEQTN